MAFRWRSSMIAAGLMLTALLGTHAWGAPVQRFKDSQGVIHITNAPPAERAETEAPAVPGSPKILTTPPVGETPATQPRARRTITLPPSEQPAGSGSQIAPPESPPEADTSAEGPSSAAQRDAANRAAAPAEVPQASEAAPEAVQPPSPIRPVAWQEPPPVPRTPVPARMSPTSGPIYTYRDSRGVLHIRNVMLEEPPELPAVQPAQRLTQPPAVRHVSAEAALRTIAPGDPSLPVNQASWRGAAPDPRPIAAFGPPAPSSREVLGDIRRYRDAKGVVHITNLPVDGPEVRPPPVNLASRSIGGLSPPAPRLPGGYPVVGPSPRVNHETCRIVASRDRHGKLVIRTEEPAVRLAAAAPPVPPGAIEPLIVEAARSHGLPVPLVAALIKVESNFVPWAVSPKGAMGLMQLMPGTAADLGVNDPFCPRQNIMAGCRYFRLLLNALDNSLPLALAAYNAGLQRVVGAGFRVPSIKETQEFVTQVLERYYHASGGRARAFSL